MSLSTKPDDNVEVLSQRSKRLILDTMAHNIVEKSAKTTEEWLENLSEIQKQIQLSGDFLLLQLGNDLLYLGKTWKNGLSYRDSLKEMDEMKKRRKQQISIPKPAFNNDNTSSFFVPGGEESTAQVLRLSSSTTTQTTQQPTQQSTLTKPNYYEPYLHLSEAQVRRMFGHVEARSIELFGVRGTGKFCTVYKANLNGVAVSVKQFKPEIPADRIMREVYHLATTHHPYVVSYLGYNIEKRWIVMEDMATGSVWSKLFETADDEDRNPNGPPILTYNIMKRLNWCLQIATAVQYLHSIGRFHCDINSKNVLLDVRMKCAKLADLGLMEEKLDANGNPLPDGAHLGKQTGTIRWMSPEMLNGKCHSLVKHDIWGLALVIMEILTGYQPYYKYESKSELKAQVQVGNVSTQLMTTLPDEYSKLSEMIDLCLDFDPQKRPPLPDLIKLLYDMHMEHTQTSLWKSFSVRGFAFQSTRGKSKKSTTSSSKKKAPSHESESEEEWDPNISD